MSEIRVNQVEGGDGKVIIEAGTVFDCAGNLLIPTWTTAGRPSEVGSAVIGYNSDTGLVEMLRGGSASSAELENDGSSADFPVTSGVDLVTRFPSKTNGTYWVKSASLVQTLKKLHRK